MANFRRPIVCLVTDRRRLCERCDEDAALRCLSTQVSAAVEAGVDLVQIRERDLDARRLAAAVSDAVALTRGTVTRIVVNDRIDVALAAGADGVHLRGDSLPAESARRLAPVGFLIGRSVHSATEAVANVGAVDYFIAGTVFSTSSKHGVPRLLGEDGLSAVVAAAGKLPVVAIGGITLDSLHRVAAAGAAGFAAIGAFLGETRPCRSANLRGFVKNARAKFDSLKTAP